VEKEVGINIRLAGKIKLSARGGVTARLNGSFISLPVLFFYIESIAVVRQPVFLDDLFQLILVTFFRFLD